MKEIISKMCAEVNEKYKKEISVTYEYIEESSFLSLFENTMMDIIDGYDRSVLTQETLIALADKLYFQIILRWFFSLNDKKSSLSLIFCGIIVSSVFSRRNGHL